MGYDLRTWAAKYPGDPEALIDALLQECERLSAPPLPPPPQASEVVEALRSILSLSGGQTTDYARAIYDIASMALSHTPEDGWTLAPAQPTEAMWQAGREADVHPGDSYTKVYCAMLAAAPIRTLSRQAPHSQASEVVDREYVYLKIVEGWLRDNRGIIFIDGSVDDLCDRIAAALSRQAPQPAADLPSGEWPRKCPGCGRVFTPPDSQCPVCNYTLVPLPAAPTAQEKA